MGTFFAQGVYYPIEGVHNLTGLFKTVRKSTTP